MVSLDSYYKDLRNLPFTERERKNFDHPSAFDFDLLTKDLSILKKNGKVDIPIYNYREHLRKRGKERLFKKDIIILEGIFSIFKEKLRDMMILKIFIDIDDTIRFKRRFQRDLKMRGRNKESI